ncbi:MAG: efflux RND transporter permease subunit [Bryobacteraceae bacterium]|nr:efflux RND transporter permease subunit [Bryobacteraceae bacterium]MDW8377837.1 efflux RND transporter permease subunit [Bryobacterales bacterium]
MLIFFLVVLGIFSFRDLGLDLFPRTDPATVYVQVRLPGASPEEVASQVVIPLEESISAISGIQELRGFITEGNARIMVTFVLDRDIGEAVEDVREKVSAAMRKLPPNVLPPSVIKADPESDPVMTLAVSGQRSQRELTEIADKKIRRAIETVDGVGGVEIFGGRNRQINLFLDIDKLNAYNLSAQDVEHAIRTENIEAPGGRIVRGPSELGVRTLGRVQRVEEFNNIIIKNVGGAPIRLRDVGYAEDGMAERRSFAYYQGKPAVMLEIRRQIGTNTVKLVDGVLKRLETIKSELPAGVQVALVKESATYIKNSVAALEEHLVLGSLLASLIVFLFIRDWRTVFISSIAIPTSVIATFTLLKLLGFTLNSMTLLGLTLAVGIVIDDAIIVLENIYRYIEEEGLPAMEAAIVATKEISLAVMATTLSLVIVFVPVAFMEGYAKKFLNQFGWTMTASILMSMLVAFTLTPTLSARMLKRKTKPGQPSQKHGHQSGWMERAYVGLLDWSLNHRWVVVAVCTLVFASTFIINQHIGRDWMPQEDQSELSVFSELPEGSSLELTERTTLAMAKRIAEIPGVRTVVPTSSVFMDRVTMSNITVLLYPQDQRAPIGEMGQKVREALRPFAATARPRVTFPNVLGGRDTFAPIRAILLGPDIRKLVELAREVNLEMAKEPSMVDLRVNLSLSNPELQVDIDRQLASDLGVRVSDIASAVRLLMSGEDQISTYKEESEQYLVTMRLLPHQRDDPSVLSRLLIPSAKQGLIRLDSVAKLERGLGPSRIDRQDRQFAVGIYANVANGYSLQQAADRARAAIDRVGLPPGYQAKFSGQVQVLEETTRNMILAIGLASIFMYMVLAAQFESLIHPFIILTTLPLSIPFALLSLIATGRTLNLFSALGVLLLLGIVKKNGILQIDYMNRLLAEGRPLREAILEANRVRLRPILMTTFSIVAGLIPTAIGIGAGASQRSAIAITIIGGQTLCLLLTLVVVPVGYSYVEEIRGWLVRRRDVPAPASAHGD